MSDVALQWSNEVLAADVSVVLNDLVPEDGLRTSVLLSLFLDRQAAAGDPLPDGETDRRGWWADAVGVLEGDQVGSRLWLLRRAKPTAETLRRAEDFAREALQWLIEDKVASQIDIVASFLVVPARALSLEITIHRPNVDPAKFRFGLTWEAEARTS